MIAKTWDKSSRAQSNYRCHLSTMQISSGCLEELIIIWRTKLGNLALSAMCGCGLNCGFHQFFLKCIKASRTCHPIWHQWMFRGSQHPCTLHTDQIRCSSTSGHSAHFVVCRKYIDCPVHGADVLVNIYGITTLNTEQCKRHVKKLHWKQIRCSPTIRMSTFHEKCKMKRRCLA